MPELKLAALDRQRVEVAGGAAGHGAAGGGAARGGDDATVASGGPESLPLVVVAERMILAVPAPARVVAVSALPLASTRPTTRGTEAGDVVVKES